MFYDPSLGEFLIFCIRFLIFSVLVADEENERPGCCSVFAAILLSPVFILVAFASLPIPVTFGVAGYIRLCSDKPPNKGYLVLDALIVLGFILVPPLLITYVIARSASPVFEATACLLAFFSVMVFLLFGIFLYSWNKETADSDLLSVRRVSDFSLQPEHEPLSSSRCSCLERWNTDNVFALVAVFIEFWQLSAFTFGTARVPWTIDTSWFAIFKQVGLFLFVR